MSSVNPYVVLLIDDVLAEFGYDWSIFARFGKLPVKESGFASMRARVWAECSARKTRTGDRPSYPELATACGCVHSTVISAVAKYRDRALEGVPQQAGRSRGHLLERIEVGAQNERAPAADGVV